jgi:hypothetical protein
MRRMAAGLDAIRPLPADQFRAFCDASSLPEKDLGLGARRGAVKAAEVPLRCSREG